LEDLHRWCVSYNLYHGQPYFEAHERPDVVAHREKFIEELSANAESYCFLSDGVNPSWIAPKEVRIDYWWEEWVWIQKGTHEALETIMESLKCI
jgi:hypothetical protein